MAQTIPAFICLSFALFSSDPLTIAAVLWPDPSLPSVMLLLPLGAPPSARGPTVGVPDLPSWGSRADFCALAACHTTSLAQALC